MFQFLEKFLNPVNAENEIIYPRMIAVKYESCSQVI